MKAIYTLLLLTLSLNIFSQNEWMDSKIYSRKGEVHSAQIHEDFMNKSFKKVKDSNGKSYRYRDLDSITTSETAFTILLGPQGYQPFEILTEGYAKLTIGKGGLYLSIDDGKLEFIQTRLRKHYKRISRENPSKVSEEELSELMLEACLELNGRTSKRTRASQTIKQSTEFDLMQYAGPYTYNYRGEEISNKEAKRLVKSDPYSYKIFKMNRKKTKILNITVPILSTVAGFTLGVAMMYAAGPLLIIPASILIVQHFNIRNHRESLHMAVLAYNSMNDDFPIQFAPKTK